MKGSSKDEEEEEEERVSAVRSLFYIQGPLFVAGGLFFLAECYYTRK